MSEYVVQESKVGDWQLSAVVSLGAAIYFFINSLLQSADLAVPIVGSIIVFSFLFLLLFWETSKWKGTTIKKREFEECRTRSVTIAVIACVIMYFIVMLLVGMMFALVISVYVSFSIYTNRLKNIESSGKNSQFTNQKVAKEELDKYEKDEKLFSSIQKDSE